MSNEYRIVFSQRTTISTSFGQSVEKGGTRYYLKAKSPRSAQQVGYATVRPDRTIEVTTCNGTIVGIAKNRAEAAKMIDGYHRKHNRRDYSSWAAKTLIV